jgi:hypothetical protein
MQQLGRWTAGVGALHRLPTELPQAKGLYG